MHEGKDVRIEVEAARALAWWKSLFAAEVCQEAKRLAAQSGRPDFVTLAHYRTAATMALQTLSAAIDGEHRSDGQHKAA